RNPRCTGRRTLLEAIHQAGIGQFGDDDQLAVDHLDTLKREEEGVADFLDAAEGLEFAAGAFAVKTSINELDRLDETAGSVGLPHFTVAAGADPLADRVSGNDFRRQAGHW